MDRCLLLLFSRPIPYAKRPETLETGDVYKRQELVEKIEEADIDPLTGVYNMRYLHRWMTAELSLMPGMGPEFSLIFADIDGLKTVNDTYGHETGNELLIYFSKILKDTVRKQDRVARYGGDEFIVVLSLIHI